MKNDILRQLGIWTGYNCQIQKRIVSAETIWGNTVSNHKPKIPFFCFPAQIHGDKIILEEFFKNSERFISKKQMSSPNICRCRPNCLYHFSSLNCCSNLKLLNKEWYCFSPGHLHILHIWTKRWPNFFFTKRKTCFSGKHIVGVFIKE